MGYGIVNGLCFYQIIAFIYQILSFHYFKVVNILYGYHIQILHLLGCFAYANNKSNNVNMDGT